MRTVWVNDDGDRFDSYEDAYDDAREKADFIDISNLFFEYVAPDRLLQWAMKQDGFWAEFDDALCQAEQDYFENWYHEEEVEDDEE